MLRSFSYQSPFGITEFAFNIIQTPAGTSPTARTNPATLTFTSTGNTVTITGNSSTNTVNFEANASAINHNSLSNLTVGDVHTQYAFLAGRSGGQSFTGGTASGNNLTLSSTTNSTKGSILFGSAASYNENTSQFVSALGSVTAPGYSFSSDLNTGIYSSGADALNFTTGGVQRGKFDSSGDFHFYGKLLQNNISPISSVPHAGVRTMPIGKSSGLTQSKPPFYNSPPTAPVDGTRTSATVFTRTSGTWETVIRTNTAQAGAATTITLDSSASASNGFYAQQCIEITSGTGSGQRRRIISYVGSTKVATVDTAWSVNPDNTSVFEIVPGGLVGQYIFSHASGDLRTGSWLTIKYNSSTAIEIASGSLNATGTAAIVSTFNPIDAQFTIGTAYVGGCFDGENLYLIPNSSSTTVQKVNVLTGGVTAIDPAQGVSNTFRDGIWDGDNVWFVPRDATNIVKYNPVTGIMSSYPHGISGTDLFSGGTFDGKSIWIAAGSATVNLKIDKQTGVITQFTHGQTTSGGAFNGAVFDGEAVWFIPNQSSNFIKLLIADDSITTIAHGQGASAFRGACFDGESLWCVPLGGNNLMKVNVATNGLTTYSLGQGSFFGAAFDGESIWSGVTTGTSSHYQLFKINPKDGSFIKFPLGLGSNAVAGTIFDGQYIWLIPLLVNKLIRVKPRWNGSGAKSVVQGLTFTQIKNPLSIGTLTGAPTGTVHIDTGDATASALKFTAGTTTGTTSTDGFEIGITTAGVGELRQRENLALNFYTNNVLATTLTAAGELAQQILGKGFSVKEGSNARQGASALVGGTVTVSTTAVTANSRIFITSNADGGTPGFVRVSGRTAGTSFTITSSSGTDTSTIAWIIFEAS